MQNPYSQPTENSIRFANQGQNVGATQWATVRYRFAYRMKSV